MTPDDLSWHGPGFPELRDGPPWVMEDMILAQSTLANPILEAPAAGSEAIAAAVSAAAGRGEPIVVTGCGTSEHGALAVAELLAQALRSVGAPSRPEARQALDAALRSPLRRRLHRHLARGHDARDDPRTRGRPRRRGRHREHRRAGRLAALPGRRRTPSRRRSSTARGATRWRT